MSLRRILKPVVPGPVRRLGWRGYYRARDHVCSNWLQTIVGSRTTRRIVALTFDDGPHPDYTPPILEILAQHQIQATFFLLGRNVAAYPGTARQIAQAGHAIGNHSSTHPRLADRSPVEVARELLECQRTIREVIGVTPEVMRPPFGTQDPASYLIARVMGYAIVNWSASGEDWRGDPAPVIAERVLADVQPGGVILLHDGLEPPPHQGEWRPGDDLRQDRSATIEALPIIIEPLHRQGYRFVTLPEMMRMGPLARQSWFE
jgi:peptidoglycan/xylan/chitin deacetylase (PgdA/CDA1 family)